MGIAPLEPVAGTTSQEIPAVAIALDAQLLAEMWRASGAAAWGLEFPEFQRIMCEAALAQNFGLPPRVAATPAQQAEFLQSLRIGDLAVAHACARGHESAWEYLVAQTREPLTRAAIAIAGNDSLGRELADQLYAELYGLTTREGQRVCPLSSYRGRGSLMAWLRTTLAQRYVDRYRRSRREESLDAFDTAAPDPPAAPSVQERTALERALEQALAACDAEARFLLAAYYLDGRTLLEIGAILRVHEATVSRKLHRSLQAIRKQVLRNLQAQGLSRRAAQEALGADPRDLDINLKNLLQNEQIGSFPEKAVP